MAGYFIVSRQDFEAWVALLDAKIAVTPDFKSLIRVVGKHENGVEYHVTATALKSNGTCEVFYGRHDDWNLVKIGTIPFSHFGAGARNQQTWKAAEEALALLTSGYHEFG